MLPRTWMEDILRKTPYYQRDLTELLFYNWKNINELGLFVTDSAQLVPNSPRLAPTRIDSVLNALFV